MKHVILAAGYATRLYPVTENYPKPLLEVGGVPILDRIVKDVDTINDVDRHLIVCNHKYFPHFEKWAAGSRYTKPITIIDDGSTDNENRLGAVKDLLLATGAGLPDDDLLQATGTGFPEDDLLVLAADNVVTFSFHGFVDYFKEKQTSIIMTHYEPEIASLQRTGVVTVDDNNRVLEMQEKPEHPKSHFAVPPFYIYKKSDVRFIQTCIDEGCNTDAPGNLVKSMLAKTIFHAWPMTGKRYDIGTLETYNQLKNNFYL